VIFISEAALSVVWILAGRSDPGVRRCLRQAADDLAVFQHGLQSSAYSTAMKHKFLLTSLSHRVVGVDITAVDKRWEVSEGFTGRNVPVAVFRSWSSAEAYFRFLGAEEVTLKEALRLLKGTGAAILTI
jgi:hypothetical protein